jgi:Uma2 family endonuclease
MPLSYHHAYLSSHLIIALSRFKNYSIFSELTLQIDGKDYIPDICLYKKRQVKFASGDILKMTEMPLLAIEVLSPTQGMQELVDKFRIYFAAGIQSCWLIIPMAQSVIVYNSIELAKTFNTGELIDDVMAIQLPVAEIFEGE